MQWPLWGSRDRGLITPCGSDQLLSFAALAVTQIHIPPTIPRGESALYLTPPSPALSGPTPTPHTHPDRALRSPGVTEAVDLDLSLSSSVHLSV